MLLTVPAFAQEHAVFVGGGIVALAAAICQGLGTFGGALSQARTASAALEGIARNPQAAPKVQTPMIIALAMNGVAGALRAGDRVLLAGEGVLKIAKRFLPVPGPGPGPGPDPGSRIGTGTGTATGTGESRPSNETRLLTGSPVRGDRLFNHSAGEQAHPLSLRPTFFVHHPIRSKME